MCSSDLWVVVCGGCGMGGGWLGLCGEVVIWNFYFETMSLWSLFVMAGFASGGGRWLFWLLLLPILRERERERRIGRERMRNR